MKSNKHLDKHVDRALFLLRIIAAVNLRLGHSFWGALWLTWTGPKRDSNWLRQAGEATKCAHWESTRMKRTQKPEERCEDLAESAPGGPLRDLEESGPLRFRALRLVSALHARLAQ